MLTLPVSLGQRSYDILIGENLLAGAAAHIQKLGIPRVLIVTDSNVAPLYGEALFKNLNAANLCAVPPYIVRAGENAKSFAELEKLLNFILSHADRKTAIIALGGGVVGDLAGFAASIALRGLPFIQIPTTLLAQVDSAVGGKTAVNAAQGKNLIGAFHQPRFVLSDIATLKTLPKRELLAGYAEVVKYGALGNAEFFAWLEKNGQAMLAGNAGLLVHAIAECCRMKAHIVARDETEQGERALLNLGHTFAHAFETASGYAMLHGEAVALGMAKAFELSVRLNLCESAEAARLIRHLEIVGLPVHVNPAWRAGDLIATMQHDKKAEGKRLTFILATAIGKALIKKDVAPADVEAVLVA